MQYRPSVLIEEEQLKDVASISKYRLELLERFCSIYRSKISHSRNNVIDNFESNPAQYNSTVQFKRLLEHHLIYNDRYRFIECRVPKTGTSKRGRYMWNLNHNEPFSEDVYIHPYKDSEITQLRHLEAKEIDTRVRNYTNFLFVRDPISRLISGYLGKIRSRKFDGFGFVRKARRLANETDVRKPLSFRGFAIYMSYLADRGRQVPNAHFSGCISYCHVCYVNYSFIGRTETMDRDFVYLATQLTNMSDKVILPVGNWESKASKSIKLIRELPRDLLDKIIRMFRNEFEAFGYDPNDVLKLL